MDNGNLTKISDDLFTLIIQFHKKMIKPEEFIKSLPIPPSHVKVIFYLSHAGSSSVSQIAKDLSISKPNMTPIIDKLIEEGYVIRYEDPNDRRVLRVEVTYKAQELFELKKHLAKSLLQEKISTLSPEDLKSLGTVVKEFSSIVDKLN
ncbi:MAG: MarR family transcriptional regulator [Clostridium sp.]|uniref:MarR family winged helix-turn-helix transcriptional regulator n=1 Tax=Clostridium sp. TaxID=1506 RepID=UPI003043242A